MNKWLIRNIPKIKKRAMIGVYLEQEEKITFGRIARAEGLCQSKVARALIRKYIKNKTKGAGGDV